MANAVTATKKSINIKPYTVSGNTLEEIYNDIIAKQVGGTDGVGDCSTPVSTPNITNFDEEENKKPKKKGTVEWTVKAKSGPKVELEATIKYPELKSDKELSAKAKKEWQRFYKELTAHEDEHVNVAFAEAEKIAQELSDMKGVGAGKDKDAAIKAAIDDYVKQYKKAYGGDKVSKRIVAAHKKLDGKGNTFTIDIDIE